MYRRYFSAAIVLVLVGCISRPAQRTARLVDEPSNDQALAYHVDLNDRADDLFKVSLKVDDLGEANAIYQFAATAPGTYQTMNIGRFVRAFAAFDGQGKPIAVDHISVNQWKISDPVATREIRYQIAETWDTEVTEFPVYPMAGTSIEQDHVQILPHAVFGYPTGMQSRPLALTLDYPKAWVVGTPLARTRKGTFLAESYDRAVDSPILLGRLSHASMNLQGTPIDIYTYSKSGRVSSERILEKMKDVLVSALQFLEKLPVDHYVFLFHFENTGAGAWEHSYSSNYVYPEAVFEHMLDSQLAGVAAHEFFHIVTPLNIHSDLITPFNFVEPRPSEHLWLYEGVTEWAAHIMLLRSGQLSLPDYLAEMANKLQENDHFDAEMSLSDLAFKSYTTAGAQEYPNIYHRGALIAGYLDILLLDLSHGQRGLREVILELSHKYGPDRAFPEHEFFDIFTRLTYPEVGDFFERFVRGTEALPTGDYFARLGIRYHGDEAEAQPMLGIMARPTTEGPFEVMDVAPELAEKGLSVGDLIVAVDGTTITSENRGATLGHLFRMEAGGTYRLTVKRGEEQLEIEATKLVRQSKSHRLEVDPAATPEQLALRNAWMHNLHAIDGRDPNGESDANHK